jgi:PAS domain S-box-containing protein
LNLFPLLSLVSAFLSVALGTFVFTRDPKSPLNRVTMLLTLAVAWSAFAEFEFRSAATLEDATAWLRVQSAWPLVFAFMVHFVLVVTEAGRRFRHPLALVLLYGSAISVVVLDVTTTEISAEPYRVWWGWSWDRPEELGAIGYATGLWVHALSLFGLYRLTSYYFRVQDHRRKQQAKHVLIGTAIPLTTFELSVVILPPLGIDVPSLALISYSIGLVFFAYAIWKYQLFRLTLSAVANEMLSTISDSLILVTLDMRIREVNRATLDLTKYERTALIGRPLSTILPESEDDNDHLPGQWLEERSSQGVGEDIETTFKTKSGGLVPMSLSISVLRASDGERLGLVFAGRDLTDRKWAEDELRKANDVLEDRVLERTAELTATSENLKAEIAERKRLEQQLL